MCAVPETHLPLLSDSSACVGGFSGSHHHAQLLLTAAIPGDHRAVGSRPHELDRFLVALNADVGFNRSKEVQWKVGCSQMLLVSVSSLSLNAPRRGRGTVGYF